MDLSASVLMMLGYYWCECCSQWIVDVLAIFFFIVHFIVVDIGDVVIVVTFAAAAIPNFNILWILTIAQQQVFKTGHFIGKPWTCGPGTKVS